jgi:hypothetical protein
MFLPAPPTMSSTVNLGSPGDLKPELRVGAREVVTGSAPLWSVVARHYRLLVEHRCFSGLDGGDGDRLGAGNVLARVVRLAQMSALRWRGGSSKGSRGLTGSR